jgi:hypothetical protein
MTEDSRGRSTATSQVAIEKRMGYINSVTVVLQRCCWIGMTDQPADDHEDVRAFRLTGLWRTESMQQRS